MSRRKRKSFDELSRPVVATPGGRAEVDRRKRAMREAMRLNELRELLGATQQEVADALTVTQANVSRIEHEDDIHVSTLSNYVSALGGQLEMTAVFPDRRVAIPLGILERNGSAGKRR